MAERKMTTFFLQGFLKQSAVNGATLSGYKGLKAPRTTAKGSGKGYSYKKPGVDNSPGTQFSDYTSSVPSSYKKEASKKYFATRLGRLSTKLTSRAGAHKKGKIVKYLKKTANYQRDYKRHRMDKRARNIQMIRTILNR